jgi:hypothetical protein
MFKRFVLLVFFSLSLAGAAFAQADPSLLALQAMDLRVAAIGHRIARANVAICPRTMPLSGILVHSIDQYSVAARPAAAATFGLGTEPMLLAVVPGSAAARAGLQAGDEIVSIAGRSFPATGKGRKGNYTRVARVEEALLEGLAKGPVEIDYVRGTERRKAMIERELGCLSRVQLIPSSRLNAGADGTYAQLTSGIVDFTRSDDELALVLAHEMAHNIWGHRVRLDGQKVSRGLLKTFDGSAGKIKATEIEADYLALYLLAGAGFDLDAAPAFWDRYGRKMGFGIFSDGTHPGRSSRVTAAERTIQEIRLKQRTGGPVTPERVADQG